jgi:hypothetical protein
MPAIITHYTFALELLKKDPSLDKEAFLVGSQGPDPFFFYGRLPWIKRKRSREINAFGTNLHHTDISLPYFLMIRYAKLSPDKDLLLSYIEGLLAHYYLDRNAHPYIFSRSGFSSEIGEKKLYEASHTALETIIDIKIGEKFRTFTIKSYRTLNIDPNKLLKISKMWSEVSKQLLNEKGFGEKVFFDALLDYRRAMRFVNNPHGLKRAFLRFAFGKRSVFYCMNFPLHLKGKYAKIDYLNETHAAWPDMVNGALYHDSFMEIWEKASEDFLTNRNQFLNDHETIEGFQKTINGYNHDGCLINDTKRYFDLIWK